MYWPENRKPSAFDDWERVTFDHESDTVVRICPKCAALIRNRDETLSKHDKWHALNGG